MIDIAVTAGVAESTIHYFEHGDGWRRDTDAIVAAYADACHTTEEALWDGALRRADPG